MGVSQSLHYEVNYCGISSYITVKVFRFQICLSCTHVQRSNDNYPACTFAKGLRNRFCPSVSQSVGLSSEKFLNQHICKR